MTATDIPEDAVSRGQGRLPGQRAGDSFGSPMEFNDASTMP